MNKTVKVDVECPSCHGTGLYAGMDEGDDSAVICTTCDGTGKTTLTYTPFTKRKEKRNIKRVFRTSAGYSIRSNDYTFSDGKEIKYSEAGCTYEEWKNGALPKPIKDLHCPLEHFGQSSDEGRWLKKNGPCNTLLGFVIPNCSKINKEQCWKFCEKHSLFKGKI